MYVVLTETPKTWANEVCAVCPTHEMAVNVMNEQVKEYISEQKGSDQIIKINNKSDINNYPESLYFYKPSNKAFKRKVNVYERKKGLSKGWIYNGDLIEKILMFKIVDISGYGLISDDTIRTNKNAITVSDVRKATSKGYVCHANLGCVMDELKTVLERRYSKKND